MDDYLDRACEYLGVDKGNVINPRIQGDDYVLIVDKGIAGSPKYYIPLSKLNDIEPESDAYEPNYRELQELAKASGIPANQKADDLRSLLWPEEPPFGVKLLPDEEE